MQRSTSLHPPGTDFARAISARALAPREQCDPVELAEQRWGSRAAAVTKASIGTSGSGLVDYDSAAREFFRKVDQASIVGQLTGMRRVPLAVQTITPSSGTSASWVASGKGAGVFTLDFSKITLPPRQVVAITALTVEMLRDSSPEAEGIVRADLARAMSEAIDLAFIDPSNAGDDATPASVANGVSPVSGTGTARADLKTLVGQFSGDLTEASFVGHPTTFAGLSSSDHPDVGVRGGSLLGAPAIASRTVPLLNSPAERPVFLIDGSGLALAEGGVEVSIHTQGDIQLADASSLSTSPPSPAQMVSLWQTGTVAVVMRRTINWQAVRPGSVSYMFGASYP